MSDLKAFRCKGCGHLVTSSHAGEHDKPLSCPVCRGGVSMDVVDKANRDAVIQEMIKASIADDHRLVQALSAKLINMPLKQIFHPENWDVLADMSADQLAVHGLLPEHVERHKPFNTRWFRKESQSASYIHTGEESSPECDACRHGGLRHVEGQEETVQLQVHACEHTIIGGASYKGTVATKEPQNFVSVVAEKTKTSESVS